MLKLENFKNKNDSKIQQLENQIKELWTVIQQIKSALKSTK